jgi:hypothetical protein
MSVVHYYLGRPVHVWIAANSRRSPARESTKAADASTAASPGQPSAVTPVAEHGQEGAGFR